MSAYIFDDIIARGVRAGEVPARTRKAREWYRNAAQETSVASSTLIKKNQEKLTTASKYEIGEMYLFNYNPKHKKTLPYYDTFPLIFPIGPAKKGFLGLNMHYLPLRERAILMNKLYQLVTDKRYDENTKLKLSYDVLAGAAKYKAFRPCIKHYLFRHLKSRMMKVDAVEWDIALFLPLARFQKASAQEVWKDSKRIIRNS